MVGPQTLNLRIVVRIHASEQTDKKNGNPVFFDFSTAGFEGTGGPLNTLL